MIEANGTEHCIVCRVTRAKQVTDVQVRREISEPRRNDRHRAAGEFSGAEQILLAAGREAPIEQESHARISRLPEVSLQSKRDITKAGRRSPRLTLCRKHRTRSSSREKVRRCSSAERMHLR